MLRSYLPSTIFSYELIIFTAFIIVSVLKHKFNIRQYFFISALFINIVVYVKCIFKTIQIGEVSLSMKNYFSYIPFQNIIKDFRTTNLMGEEFTELILAFFLTIIPFFVLFGIFIPGIFKKRPSYKKILIWGIIFLEVLLLFSFIIICNDMVEKGIFDTSAFIIAPIFYALGIFIYKTLFDRKRKAKND